MPLDAVLPVIGEVRALPATPLFSVTASHVGKRNYSSDEIKQHVADALTASRPWQYTQNDADADLNVRLFIEGEGVDVGARLAKGPLYKRDYAVADYPGSLKPPLAAALIRIAAPRAGQILLDPFCGSGTILLESLPLGLQILAGDISSHAVESCRNRNLDVRQWDARSLPLEDSSVDRIVSNLPWGDQSVIKTESAGFYHDICREMERVLKPDGKIVLLTTLAEQVQFSSLRLELNREISLFGKRPAILKFC